MRFTPAFLNAEERDLQEEVRTWLAGELPRGSFEPGLGMDAEYDPSFSQKLGARGWLGMTLPKEYGGSERSAVERFIVVEELLRWGAPVHSHWIADRQTGPVINRFGTTAQKQRFLPLICKGEVQFAIGMSEPDSGSDLAALKTRAQRVTGGWEITGTKVWSTGAHIADWLLILCRTSGEEDRHDGLTQMLVDLKGSEGLTVRPIICLDGRPEFSEIKLESVFVPDDLVLGDVGNGWRQNMSELSYERSGPDRWLSTYLVVEEFMRDRQARQVPLDERSRDALGRSVARWWTLRQLSLSVARMVDEGATPSVEASLVKELGTRFEQDVLELFDRLIQEEPALTSESALLRLLARCTLVAPSLTIRGGTTEILRTVAARGLTA